VGRKKDIMESGSNYYLRFREKRSSAEKTHREGGKGSGSFAIKEKLTEVMIGLSTHSGSKRILYVD